MTINYYIIYSTYGNKKTNLPFIFNNLLLIFNKSTITSIELYGWVCGIWSNLFSTGIGFILSGSLPPVFLAPALIPYGGSQTIPSKLIILY